jgi:hypothetical protein
MTTARFGIGIDLGTTNSALAFVPLNGEAKSEILEIPQWEAVSEVTESPALPSFLYLPDKATAQMQDGAAGNGEWIVGRFARKKAGETPGRVIHSAKSWLCHHTSDRLAGFLPWGSDDIARDRKISPVRASALILNHLKEDGTAGLPAPQPSSTIRKLRLPFPLHSTRLPSDLRLWLHRKPVFLKPFDCSKSRRPRSTAGWSSTILRSTSGASYRTVKTQRITSWWSTSVAVHRISACLNSALIAEAPSRELSARQSATTSCSAATMSITQSHTFLNRG